MNFSTIKSDSHMVAALSLNIVAYQAIWLGLTDSTLGISLAYRR